ncbi:putative recombination initiation defects 3 [Humulus lupulus]|uniref:putative recombination initiation defects 3 n=1 Tax=Humulus lupulus TaxID=3486 RepID=UPI002B40F07E|nr:putative recombination initiation defects 3 [Humulus lupulus]
MSDQAHSLNRSMKLKINNASDLSSISALSSPQARRSNTVTQSHGPQTSQLRSQPSQQSFSRGLSSHSQHGVLSQISQSSLDDVLTNDQLSSHRFSSQERENPVKKVCLPPTSHTREESQMPISSTSLPRKWTSSSLSDHRLQISEELEHRIGMMETSLNRFGMILDSVQTDVMQANKGTKEVLLETEGIRQKLVVQDNLLQLMIKGQEDIKASLDLGFKSTSDQVNKHTYQDKFQEIFSVLSTLPQKIEASIQKSQNEFRNSFAKEMQATTSSVVLPDRKDQVAPIPPPNKVTTRSAARREMLQQIMKLQEIKNNYTDFGSAASPKVSAQTIVAVPKIETGGWKSVKSEKVTFTNTTANKVHKQIGASSIHKERQCRIIIESDEEIDRGFSCLFKENESDLGSCLIDEVKEETKRILRKARRRKRQCCNTILIN